MSERERLIKEIRAKLDEFVFDSDHEAAVQAVMNCIDRAAQITPQSGAEPYLQQWAKHSKEAIQSAAEYYQHKSDRTAPPRPVCPHIRSSDEGTQWCDLAAVAPAWQPKARVYAWLGYWRDKMPPEAVEKLQNILGPLNDSPGG